MSWYSGVAGLDGNSPNIGTSFSAPQVAGVAALMLSVNPALAPADLISRIRSTARTFPSDPSIPTCPTTSTVAATLGQCNCTTTTCGAGLLDAGAAVDAAASPIASITAPTVLEAGSTLTLDGSGSSALGNRSIVSWHWTLTSAPAGAVLTTPDAAVTGLQAPIAGSYQVALAVTDSLGGTGEASVSLSVTDPPVVTPPPVTNPPDSGSSGGGGGGGGGTELWLLGLLACAAVIGRRPGAGARQASRHQAKQSPR